MPISPPMLAIIGFIICGPIFMLPISGAIIGFMAGCIIGAPPLAIIAVAPVMTIVRSSGGSCVSWSSGMPEKFYKPEKMSWISRNARTTHHDVRLQHSSKIAELAPAVTVRLPADLVEPVVEPVADIGARPPPRLLCERGHVHFEYRPPFEHSRRGWIDRRVRGRRGDGRER